MPRSPDCDRCHFASDTLLLVCYLHPCGPEGNDCPDFREQALPSVEQTSALWEPDGFSYYNDELIRSPLSFLSAQERRELLDTHPILTGRCPNCEHTMQQTTPPRVHWDCDHCGWKDDSL